MAEGQGLIVLLDLPGLGKGIEAEKGKERANRKREKPTLSMDMELGGRGFRLILV